MTRIVKQTGPLAWCDDNIARIKAGALYLGPDGQYMRTGVGSDIAGLMSTVASAATRVRVHPSRATSGANFVRTSRTREKAPVPVTDPWCEYWNGYVNTGSFTVNQEQGTGNAVPIAGAFVTNITGTGQNQTGATLTPLTWANAAAGTPGYAYKLDGTPGTGAEFTAAGGSISGDNQTLTVPNGWYVRSDSCAGLTLSGAYYIQWEEAAPTSSFYPSGFIPGGRTSLGDLNKDATTRSGVFLLNWTTLTGVAVGTAVTGPCNVFGISATGKKTVGIAGDSIASENFDRDGSAQYGDADGATAFIGRALNAAGYPGVRTAVVGVRASTPELYGGFAIRALMMRYCHAVITDMGHNDRGFNWATALPYLRGHWSKCRAAGVGGNARVIATTWCPQSNSTDNWATKANQTPTMGAGTMGFDSYNPYIRAGSFNVGLGDPNAGYDLYNAIYAGATAAGATDISDTYWPTNGTAKAFANDTTHPAQIVHAYVATDLAGELPTLMQF